MNTGVYQIRCVANRKCYIGSSSRSLTLRRSRHFSELKTRCHPNRHLQRAWDKYGSQNFVFEVLQYCPPKECISREQYWIDKKKSFTLGFNLSPTSSSILGSKRPKLAITKTVVANIGKIRSRESCEKISQAKKGKPMTERGKKAIKTAMNRPFVRAKISKAAKARKLSTEHKLKLSAVSSQRWDNHRSGVKVINIATGDRTAAVKYPGLFAGEKNGRAKITDKQRIEIKRLKSKGISTRLLAKKYNLHETQINRVCKLT